MHMPHSWIKSDNLVSCGGNTVYIVVFQLPKQQCSMRLSVCLVTCEYGLSYRGLIWIKMHSVVRFLRVKNYIHCDICHQIVEVYGENALSCIDDTKYKWSQNGAKCSKMEEQCELWTVLLLWKRSTMQNMRMKWNNLTVLRLERLQVK